MVGTQVGNYLIEEQLGEGGMGTVYRALEIHLERQVAIKVLNADLARNPAIVERFRAEARTQANLIHPNVALLYSFLVQDGNAMMVMEYVEGENIQEIVRRNGPIHIQQAIPWFKQALAGIGAAHRIGIVHRDIKPSNLMLNRSGVVKVLDFGIAKVTGGERRLTSAGTKLGTVFYMSPEQIQAGAVDNRSDIYSLGVTLYEMLTSRVPFDSDSDFTVQRDHIQTPPPMPTAFAPYLPKGIERIILKALEKRPADRFQMVEEFSAALDHPTAWEAYIPTFAQHGHRSTVVQPAPPPPPQRAPTVVQQPYQVFNIPPAQPLSPAQPLQYVPPPAVAKPFWVEKWKMIAAAAVAVIILGFLVFRPSPTPTPAPGPGPTPIPGPVPTPVPPPVDPSAVKIQQLNGIWTGGYRCNQGTNTMGLAIQAASLQQIHARLSYPTARGYATYELTGTFTAAYNGLEFRFQRWINNPFNVAQGTSLRGVVDFNTGTYSGQVLEAGCADFSVQRLRQ